MEGLKFSLTWEQAEEEKLTMAKLLDQYLSEHQVYEFAGLTIGAWQDAWDKSSTEVIDYLVTNKAKFPNLKQLFLGDMESEECEVSWIMQDNLSPLLESFALEELIVKGANGLRFKNAISESLKKLTIISGGISKITLKDIAEAHFPNLEYLELWLGVEDYGFDAEISELEVFMQAKNYPKLKYLGLKNSELQDQITEKLFEFDLVQQLEVLDLSLGTLSDQGGQVLLEQLELLRQLKKLDLTHHFLSDQLVEELETAFKNTGVELLIDPNGADSYQDEDEEYRYPYLTE